MFLCLQLGLTFQHRLEASHVIDKRQVWVGVIAKGPNGQSNENLVPMVFCCCVMLRLSDGRVVQELRADGLPGRAGPVYPRVTTTSVVRVRILLAACLQLLSAHP
jgi:hypothetical protein